MLRNAIAGATMMELRKHIVIIPAVSVKITNCAHTLTPLNGVKRDVMSTVPLTVEFSVRTGNAITKTWKTTGTDFLAHTRLCSAHG